MGKPKQVNVTRRLVLSFSALIFLFLLFGLFTLYEINTLTNLTGTIYHHPLVVSNAAIQSNVSIGKIHRIMKDVVLFKTSSQIQQSIEAVHEEEKQVQENLDIIKSRILGEEGKTLEIQARKLFDEWRPIREEVIRLILEDQRAKAENIAAGKGAGHVALLEEKMLGLTKYARKKASDFIQESERVHSRLNVVTIFLWLLGILTSTLLAFLTIKQISFAEKQLQESEEKHRLLFESAGDAIFIHNAEGRILEVNPMACELLGYSHAELMSMTIDQADTPEEARHAPDRIARLMAQGHLKFETVHQHKDGSPIPIEVSARLISWEGQPAMMSICRDITERKRAEVSIKNREQLLNEIGNIAKIGGWEHDLVTGEATWTRETYKIAEIESGPVPGPDEHLNYYPPKDRAVLEKAYRRAMETGEQFDLDLQCTTAKGHLLWVHAIGRPEFKDGKCVGMKGTFQDITGRKKVEDQLQQSRKMEAVGSLAGGIAHDFNNILTIILGNAQLASSDVPGSNPASEFLKEIYKASIRAKDMVRQLLSFSRKTEEEYMPLDLAFTIKESMKMLRPAIPSSIEFKQHITNDVCNILGDVSQINQIVMNLAINAADAMSEEGGVLEVTLENIILLEEKACFGWVLSPGPYVRLGMRDTGEGIEPEIMDRIFEPYLHNQGSRQRHGNGSFGNSRHRKETWRWYPGRERTWEGNDL